MSVLVIPRRELQTELVHIPTLVSMAFNISKSQARRSMKEKSVEIVERENGSIYRRFYPHGNEYLLTRSEKVETIVRLGRQWRKVDFV